MDEMKQDEAMNMSNEQAVQILKPMMDMMRDQHGCPISDAYFAIEKAIHALSTISPDELRGVGKWINKTMSVPNAHGQTYNRWGCSVCKAKFKSRTNYCPNCGAKMEVSK